MHGGGEPIALVGNPFVFASATRVLSLLDPSDCSNFRVATAETRPLRRVVETGQIGQDGRTRRAAMSTTKNYWQGHRYLTDSVSYGV